MSVIQKIQDKYAKLMAVIIAIALLTFVIMLAFENGGSLFQSGNINTVGKVNGKKIELTAFENSIKQQEANLEQQGYPAGNALRQQAIDQAWGQEVAKLLITAEVDKLGMKIGKKEMGDILYGANPAQILRQQFTDPNTGVFDAVAAKQGLDQALKKGTAEQKQYFNSVLNDEELNRLFQKYNSLLTNSTNFPKWLVEKENADNSQLAKISVVREFYTSIPDSSVKITDKEIEDYISKHPKDFKQEESRSISYVTFSALPTAADTAQSLKDVITVKPEFDSASNVEDFLARNVSSIPYTRSYYPRSQLLTANQQMNMSFKDTILSLAKNAVYGPYLDGNSYALAKMIDSRVLPDSVKCRHILLGTEDPQTKQPLLPDSIAKKRVDSIELAIKNGANFDSLEAKYTMDQGAHRDKGVMTFSSVDIQAPNFAKEFCQFILFDGKPGDKKVVKTSYGWHYIEILSAIKPETHYNVAYFSKPIEASQETDNTASNEATKFAGDSRNQKQFDANSEKLKLVKGFATNITPAGYQIQGLGISRAFVKSIYSASTGEVLQPERVGDNYVVALVTEVNKKGTQKASVARLMVEPILRNQKKAEIIQKKIGNITSLEAVATTLGKTIETVDSIRVNGAQGSIVASEPKVIGAAFNPANTGKVVNQAIAGTSGVYVVRVESLSATAVADANVTEQRKSRYDQGKMRGGINQQALKDAADIKDDRSKIY